MLPLPRCLRPLPFVALALATTTAYAAWTDFRGPAGDGHVAAAGAKPAGFPLTWSDTENVTWKTAIPGKGWSTPAIRDGRVWVTTASEDGRDYFVLGLDQKTGEVLVNEKVHHTDSPEPLGNGASMNCFATPSPVIEAGRLYVHFGSVYTGCLDTKTAKVLWSRTDLKCRHYRGASSSPVLFENLLILTFDGADLQYVAALDKQTGATVWKTDRSVAWNDESVPGPMAKDGDLRKSHGTPLLATVAGQPQLISVGAKATYGYDPRTGHELWRVEYHDWSSAPRPLFHQGIAYIVTGLTRKELWAVRTDGRGVVTDTHVVWKLNTRVGKYASPLLVDGLLYTAADESFISCVDAATGQVVWVDRVGGKYAASPIYADGRMYFFSQDGRCSVLKPGRTLELLATNTLPGGFMASPAADGRALYLRTKTHLYRVENKGAGSE